MQKITTEKYNDMLSHININHEASRLGFYGESSQSLINIVSSTIENKFSTIQSNLESKIESLEIKIKQKKNHLNEILDKIKDYPISAKSILSGGICLVLLSMILLFDFFLSIINAPLLLVLSIAGNIVFHIRSNKNQHLNNFMLLSFYSVAMMIVVYSLYKMTYNIFIALGIGLVSGVIIHLLNIHLGDGFDDFLNQIKAFFLRLNKFIAKRDINRDVITSHEFIKELNALKEKKRLEIKENTDRIEYEYCLGAMLANSIKNKNSKITINENQRMEEYPRA